MEETTTTTGPFKTISFLSDNHTHNQPLPDNLFPVKRPEGPVERITPRIGSRYQADIPPFLGK
jgi:hypothetical protein